MNTAITIGIFLAFCLIGGVLNYAMEEDRENTRFREYLKEGKS